MKNQSALLLISIVLLLSGCADTPKNTRALPTDTPKNTRVLPTDTPKNTRVLPTDTPKNTRVLPADTPKNTRVLPADTPYIKSQQSESMVVFMRPSRLGFSIQSSVFDIVNDKPSLVGILAPKSKVAYKTKAGTHLFMLHGENTEFMTAELLPDKTYYVYVSPRWGLLKTRVVLEPKTLKDLEEARFKSDLEACKWVEVNAESLRWLNENMPSIQSKRAENYPDWQKKPEEEKLKLRPTDGR